MNTLKNCPKVLLNKMLLTALIGVGCLIVGVAYFIFAKDKITLLLSGFIFVFSLFRGIGLYNIISGKKYDAIEGVCVVIKQKPFGKYYTVKIIDDNGIETSLRLGKQAKIKIGFRYRFYFKHGERFSLGNEYLDSALSAELFLGYEELGEFVAQKEETKPSESKDKINGIS